jgi:hypothetical protein
MPGIVARERYAMAIIHYGTAMRDEERRARLYEGELFLLPPTPEGIALCEHARAMVEEAFHPLEPRTAQHEMPVEQYAALLNELKPAFIHHPESKRIIQELLDAVGCDLEETYFDVPRLRTSTSDDYLTTGIAFAFHPHRDTWYSAPSCQLNWWLPVYPIERDNGLAFFPDYSARSVENSSACYDYGRWKQTSRFNAANHIGKDTRKQPVPLEEISDRAELRPLGEPGSIVLFAANELHASVPNSSGVTRFSIDFRTVHGEDAKVGRGARLIDAQCTGSAIGDFLRGSDLEKLPADLVARFESGELR